MPRQRSPNRDRAFEIYKEHGGNIENRRIAEMLDISEKKQLEVGSARTDGMIA